MSISNLLLRRQQVVGWLSGFPLRFASYGGRGVVGSGACPQAPPSEWVVGSGACFVPDFDGNTDLDFDTDFDLDLGHREDAETNDDAEHPTFNAQHLTFNV